VLPAIRENGKYISIHASYANDATSSYEHPRIVRKRCDTDSASKIPDRLRFQSTHRTQTMRHTEKRTQELSLSISIHASYANDATISA